MCSTLCPLPMIPCCKSTSLKGKRATGAPRRVRIHSFSSLTAGHGSSGFPQRSRSAKRRLRSVGGIDLEYFMTLNLPAVFNASAFAEELIRRHNTKAVGFAILQLLDAASAHSDLLFARELLATIVLDAQGQIEHPSPYSDAVRGALLAQTILLYARATIVSSRRRRFDILPRLTSQQRAAHAEIEEMRNRAIAHFDRSLKHGEALWADERVVYPSDEPFRLIPAIRRLVVREEIVRMLIDQVDAALEVLDSIRREKDVAAVTALRKLLADDPQQIERLKSYGMDVMEFLGDFKTAADMLGPGFGSGKLHSADG